ncbi:2-hydroxyacid dehydrogenase [uncultured Cytophaga sp.]|uniref:2-hydroxyacid dehydrogenase n=1 Tax=uncultured Cytophaga sp. TaxID=160238 RepID=UPI002604E69E|nr:2-hydroxyacid dehydrogenase [uncultured Cytophaga sp.]
MKVIVYSANQYDITHFQSQSDPSFEFEFVKESLNIDTTDLARGAFAVCIFVNDDASKPVLEKLSALGVRAIAIRAAGHDQTDHVAAHQLGLHVGNVPAYSPNAIAEHTVAMLLTLSRKIVEADKRVKSYDFTLDPLVGFNLHHKKVGIIGVGKIGGITAKILQGFGCKLIAYDPQPNAVYTKEYGLQYVSLDELFRESEIIIIQAPLNAHTKYLINSNAIATMRDGVYIINTGRGPIINTIDAIEGLKSGKIGALGIDVYEKEKGLFFNDHTMSIPTDDVFARLLTFKNVLVTGHMAFLTTNALDSIVQTTMDNLNAWKSGQDSPNEI